MQHVDYLAYLYDLGFQLKSCSFMRIIKTRCFKVVHFLHLLSLQTSLPATIIPVSIAVTVGSFSASMILRGRVMLIHYSNCVDQIARFLVPSNS